MPLCWYIDFKVGRIIGCFPTFETCKAPSGTIKASPYGGFFCISLNPLSHESGVHDIYSHKDLLSTLVWGLQLRETGIPYRFWNSPRQPWQKTQWRSSYAWCLNFHQTMVLRSIVSPDRKFSLKLCMYMCYVLIVRFFMSFYTYSEFIVLSPSSICMTPRPNWNTSLYSPFPPSDYF